MWPLCVVGGAPCVALRAGEAKGGFDAAAGRDDGAVTRSGEATSALSPPVIDLAGCRLQAGCCSEQEKLCKQRAMIETKQVKQNR